MIGSSFDTALSGLRAAELRLSNSANNVANQNSSTSRIDGERVAEPYRPMEVVQSSNATGGVRTELRPLEPASIPVYNPNDPAADAEGIALMPNVDLEEELVGQELSSYTFKANLKSLEAADKMVGSLLDIFA